MFSEAQLDQNGPIFQPGTIRYWVQDGADFYLFDSQLAARGEVIPNEPITQCTYPQGVADWDMAAAIKARDWFLSDWCVRNNVNPIKVD